MLTVTILAGFLLGSCGGDDDKRPAECEEITEACHKVDQGTGPIHECHESSEATWTKDECVMNSAMCLAVCASASDGGAPADH